VHSPFSLLSLGDELGQFMKNDSTETEKRNPFQTPHRGSCEPASENKKTTERTKQHRRHKRETSKRQAHRKKRKNEKKQETAASSSAGKVCADCPPNNRPRNTHCPQGRRTRSDASASAAHDNTKKKEANASGILVMRGIDRTSVPRSPPLRTDNQRDLQPD